MKLVAIKLNDFFNKFRFPASPLIFLFTLIMRNCKFAEKTIFCFIVFFNVFQDLKRLKNVSINVIVIINETKDVQ